MSTPTATRPAGRCSEVLEVLLVILVLCALAGGALVNPLLFVVAVLLIAAVIGNGRRGRVP